MRKKRKGKPDEWAFNNLDMTKTKYKLGDLEFNTKSEITAYYKSMLNTYNKKTLLNRKDSTDIYWLLKEHPHVDIKMNQKITSIYVDTAMHNTRCFYLNYEDGTRDDFSYTQCIKNIKKHDR